MKKVLIIMGGSLLGFGGIWAYRKKLFGDKIVINNDIKVKVGDGKTFGIPNSLTLEVTPTIKNPTSVRATITHPFVQLRIQKESVDPFTSSQFVNKTYNIEPLSTVSLDTIKIPVSLTSLALSLPALVTEVVKNNSLTLYAKTSLYLVTGASKLPVEKLDESVVKF